MFEGIIIGNSEHRKTTKPMESTEEATTEATEAPTVDYWIEVTTPAGEPARIAREASIVDLMVVVLLLSIVLSMWAMYSMERLRSKL